MAYNKLKGRLRELDKTYKEASKVIGVSEATFVSKINGKTPFKLPEAEKLCNWLGLNEKEKIEFFLP